MTHGKITVFNEFRKIKEQTLFSPSETLGRMSTCFGRSDLWDRLCRQALITNGRWYSRQPSNACPTQRSRK